MDLLYIVRIQQVSPSIYINISKQVVKSTTAVIPPNHPPPRSVKVKLAFEYFVLIKVIFAVVMLLSQSLKSISTATVVELENRHLSFGKLSFVQKSHYLLNHQVPSSSGRVQLTVRSDLQWKKVFDWHLCYALINNIWSLITH